MKLSLDEWLEKQEELLNQQIEDQYQLKRGEGKKRLVNATSLEEEKNRRKNDFYLVEYEQDIEDVMQLLYSELPERVEEEKWQAIFFEIARIGHSTEEFLNKNGSLEIDPSVQKREILGLSNETLLTLYSLGLQYYEEKNYEPVRLINTFLTLVAPEVSSFWIALGRSKELLGDIYGAIETFDQAKESHPNVGKLYFFSAECYHSLHKLQKVNLELSQLEKLTKESNQNLQLYLEGKRLFQKAA